MPASKEFFHKKFFRSYFFLFASIVMAIILSFSYFRAYYQDYQTRQDIKNMRQNAKDLEIKKIQLLETLQYVQSQSFVEEKARTDLNMAKVGEKLVIMPVNSSTMANGRQVAGNLVKLNTPSNYSLWWRVFTKD
ncbi:MAG: hypothetical protein COU31_04675 [Candidatus Magasanikbacteria bacterium CG10_big_fil_rev_8_21_14_0_10_40_10]|uniref:Cell division protein FtsL n=1 Tax=Candidatus Magasanikbacteria bacterium CG10_big_fil_rev_8_21_14_0_10_40_10 TaxID=1974648 RepID=A0A2M6W2U9_9BACT|nr:MAG: hypothetical protein COU31_04675 [Candidatus Magasanikbacteria bacterium CG10_big_fil_rev_8_21_14_0_10_40_10]